MLPDIQDKRVTLCLNFSAWGDTIVVGDVVEISDAWVKLKIIESWPKLKKDTQEYIFINTIKKIKIHSKS